MIENDIHAKLDAAREFARTLRRNIIARTFTEEEIERIRLGCAAMISQLGYSAYCMRDCGDTTSDDFKATQMEIERYGDLLDQFGGES